MTATDTAGGAGGARPLDLLGPLPTGLTALDASAGTGKTFALTALATRWLVEGGRDPGELLVVTFTRPAAAQLRARIRSDLRAALAVLDAARAGTAAPRAPDWTAALLATDGDGLAARRAAAAQALEGFERATVATLHAFCRAALVRLGLLGDAGGREAAQATARVRADVVRDLMLGVLAEEPGGLVPPGAKRPASMAALEARVADALEKLLDDPEARVLPAAGTAGLEAERLAGLVRSAAAEVRRRLDVRAELDFGQLIARMDELLADPARGPEAARRLRARTRLVLVDEMQDTDAVQWRVLRGAFLAEPEVRGRPADMVVVGDPKQSIYRFRGADVAAYGRARAAAPTQHVLTVNHRSSPQLLGALNLLMAGATFGRDADHVPVTPPEGAGPVLAGVDGALELRWVPRHDGLMTGRGGGFGSGSADALVLEDLAARAAELLRDGELVATEERPARPLGPGDLAVLVASGRDADAAVAALRAAGLPAVRPRGGSVLESEAVEQWRLLLAALEAPHDRRRVRALLLSWFVAAPAARLGDTAAVEALQERCAAWARVLGRRGVLPLLATLESDAEVAPALARAGERGRTDLEHLAQLLHEDLGARPAPPGAVRRAFDGLVRTTGGPDADGEDRAQRRIETDGGAIQVMTFHAAKGLEWPVVLLPVTTKRTPSDDLHPWRWTEDGGAAIDVASWTRWTGRDPDSADADPGVREARTVAADAEDRARILYVAMTRARGRLVMWWAPRDGADASLLARLLFARRDAEGRLDPGAATPTIDLPDDATTARKLAAWSARSGGAIVVAEVPAAVTPVAWTPPAPPERGEPATALLHREPVEAHVARWSFSRLRSRLRQGEDEVPGEPTPPAVDDDGEPTAGAPGRDEDPAVASPGPDAADVDVDVDAADGDAGAGPRDGTDARVGARELADVPAAAPTPGLLADLRGGTEVGTVVHEILEVVDLSAADLHAEVAARVAAQPERRLALLGDDGAEALRARLTDGLVAALRTPLDQVAPDLRLCDLAPRDRLSEPPFELPITDTAAPVEVAALADAVARELPAGPVRTLLEGLAADPRGPRIAGWLTGVADLVVRLPDGRYAVLDHKTNRLVFRPAGTTEERQRYDQPMMEHVACRDHYVLQGLLYLVALHRWLDRRLDGYDPAHHLGGFGLLFLRGMSPDSAPDATGARPGVWWWRPPAAAIVAADRVLGGGGPA